MKKVVALIAASIVAGVAAFAATRTIRGRSAAPTLSAVADTMRPVPSEGDSLPHMWSTMAADSQMFADVLVDSTTRVPPLVPDSIAWLIGELREYGKARYPWIFQEDRTMSRPIAVKDGMILLVRGKNVTRAKVLSRFRIIGKGDESCGGFQLDSSLRGWAYSVGRHPAISDTNRVWGLALPNQTDIAVQVDPSAAAWKPFERSLATGARVSLAKFRAQLDSAAREQERSAAAMQREMFASERWDEPPDGAEGLAETLRQYLYEADGSLSKQNRIETFSLRIAGKQVFGAALTLNDDLGGYGLENTRWIMFVDSAGAQLGRVEGGRDVFLVADMNRDGTDEIVTDEGVLFLNGKRWVLARSAPPPPMC